ncbi:MAG TPA: hypothetical protein VGJ28_04520 [Micromonosporaceae bacterium]|jgi:hypothetical protein
MAQRLIELRDGLLTRLMTLLRADPEVEAVAQIGSLARGNDDAWSDLDLMIFMPPEVIATVSNRAWALAPLVIDSRHNAPAGATQINAVHVLDGLPFWVDLCVFPSSPNAEWPSERRVLFARRGFPTGTDSFDELTSREPRQPPVPNVTRRTHLALVPLTAKYIARGYAAHVRDMTRVIGPDPDYADLDLDRQLKRLREIAADLADPEWSWLSTAVSGYLDLIERPR